MNVAIRPRKVQGPDIPIGSFSEGYAWVCRKVAGNSPEWFYIDRNGTEYPLPWLCPMDKNRLTSFRDGMAAILVDDCSWSFIDRNFNIVVPGYKYTDAEEGFSDGFAKAKNKDGVWGFLDKSGGWHDVPQPCIGLTSFSDGLAGVCRPDGVWGFIDRNMSWKIPPTVYTDADAGFSGGFCKARRNGVWGFIDILHGEWHDIPQPCAILGSFQDGLAGVCLPDSGVWGFIGPDMQWVIPPTVYTNADEGQLEDFIKVKRGDQWGFINDKGRWFDVPQPCAILSSFQEGLAGVCLPESGIWGFVDDVMGQRLDWVISPTGYTYADYGFSERLCPAFNGSQWGYFDITGKWVLSVRTS